MINATQNSPKFAKKYSCQKCDYSCSKKSDFLKHNESIKHNATKTEINATKNSPTCDCGKKYKHLSSFHRHKKICNFYCETIKDEKVESNKNDNIGEDMNYKDMFLHMMKQNQELQKTMQEIIPNIGNNNNNINNT